jgi:hypothetical protein
MKQAIAGALCVWAILAAGCGERAEPLAAAPASAEPSVRSEQAEPLGNWADFRFETTAGKPVSLGDYKGKTLLVDVWSYT